MTHRGPFQPLPFCDSVILLFTFNYNFCLESVRVINPSYRRRFFSSVVFSTNREKFIHQINLCDLYILLHVPKLSNVFVIDFISITFQEILML